MNFDAMCRAGAAGRLTLIKAAAEMMGVPENELPQVNHASSREVEEERHVCPNREKRQGEQDLGAGRA